MKILIVSSKYAPAIGGLETAVKNIVAELIHKGHTVRIITNRYSRKIAPHEIIDGVSVQRCYFTDCPPKIENLWSWFKYFVGLMIAPISFSQLFMAIKKFRPDVVHLHYVGAPSLYLLAAKALLKFPLVVSIHGSDAEFYPFKSDYQEYVLKRVFEAGEFITANSRHLLNAAILMTKVNISQKSRVVSMAFTYSHHDHPDPVSYASEKYLFCAGRFIPKKGQDVLIKAFAQLISDAQYGGDLILAGDGPELESCKQLAKKFHLEKRIHFFGVARDNQMASLMKHSDLIIVPSRMEGFGIVVLEGLYAGKRVLASKVGGMVDLMKDNPEYLVEPGNVGLLAELIKKILSGHIHWNPVDTEILKKEYSWMRVSDDYLKIYEKILFQHDKA